MAASGEAAQRDTLEFPAGITPATTPLKDDVAIPMLYDQTLKALQCALALHDPAALPSSSDGDGGATADAAAPTLHVS